MSKQASLSPSGLIGYSHLMLHVYFRTDPQSAWSGKRSVNIAISCCSATAPHPAPHPASTATRVYRAYTATPRPFRDQSAHAPRLAGLAARLQSYSGAKMYPLATSRSLNPCLENGAHKTECQDARDGSSCRHLGQSVFSVVSRCA